MPNLYTTLDAVKGPLGFSSITTHDAALLALIEQASRAVDVDCNRHFYAETAVRLFDVKRRDRVAVDDLLAVTTLETDGELDLTYDTTWTASDYFFNPPNSYPKTLIVAHPTGTYTFTVGERALRVTGSWGFGDGKRAAPWDSVGATGTVATTNGTTLTLSVSAAVKVGETILCETEQMYVSAVSGTSATVTRGVNGTTAATHSTAALSRAAYPASVVAMTEYMARAMFSEIGKENIVQERIGEYSWMAHQRPRVMEEQMLRVLGPFRRLGA